MASQLMERVVRKTGQGTRCLHGPGFASVVGAYLEAPEHCLFPLSDKSSLMAFCEMLIVGSLSPFSSPPNTFNSFDAVQRGN